MPSLIKFFHYRGLSISMCGLGHLKWCFHKDQHIVLGALGPPGIWHQQISRGRYDVWTLAIVCQRPPNAPNHVVCLHSLVAAKFK